MPAGRYDIVAEQGSTFTLELNYQNSDSTGFDFTDGTTDADYIYGVRMQVRKSSTQVGTREPILYISTNDDPLSTNIPSVDTEGLGGGVVYFEDGVAGAIHIKVLASTMALLSAKRYFYDIELFTTSENDDEDVTKIIKGTFDVEGEVTT